MRTHTGEKPNKCTYCDVAYAQKNDLVKHLRRCHLGENIYQCNFCESSSFQYFTEWKKHMQTSHPQEDCSFKNIGI